MKIKSLLLFLLLGGIASPVFALPGAFNANYSVSKSGLTLGEMRVSLTYGQNTYAYHKATKATGLASWLSGDRVIENVEGKINRDVLRPGSYIFHHTSKRKNRKDQLQFVTPRLVKGEYKKQAYQIQVPQGTLDRATLELVLARDLAHHKKNMVYSVVERGKLKTYRFAHQGTEKIPVGDKEYQAEKLMVVREGTVRKTTFWLAPELGYMPVKINHIEKGDAIVTHLKWFQSIKPGSVTSLPHSEVMHRNK